MDWASAVKEGRRFEKPLPPEVQTFVFLARLAQYGIHLTVDELDGMPERMIILWDTVMSYLPANYFSNNPLGT